jgi:hypothetical protein
VAHQRAGGIVIVLPGGGDERRDVNLVSHRQHNVSTPLDMTARKQPWLQLSEVRCNRCATRPVIAEMKKLLILALLVFSNIAAHGDWKTLLHGTPPKATPGPPDATAATVSFAPEVPVDKPLGEFLNAFAEALRVHDGTALKPRISDKYQVPEFPEEKNGVEFLMQAIVKAKAPNELIVTSIQPDGDGRVAKVEFRSADRPAKTKTFRFDAAGKLISSDMFTLQRHGFGS